MSYDSPDENLAWATDEGFQFELWSDDANHTLAEYYDAATPFAAQRRTKIMDSTGTLVLEYAVSAIGTHPAQVLEDCQALFGP